MAAAYLFFNYNCILAYEISFSGTQNCVVFIAQINHYGKFTALHQLSLIVLQLTNQIK